MSYERSCLRMVSGIRAVALLGLLPVVQVATGHAQTLDAGEQAFRGRCQACHSFTEDGKPGTIGPNLHGVVGRKAAATAFRNYSPALKSSNLVWDEQTLDAFLTAPKRVVPGTRMTATVGDAKLRAAIIEYLASVK